MNIQLDGKNPWKGTIIVLAALTLAACGGGGGSTPVVSVAASNPAPAAGTTPPPATSTTPPPATGTTPPPATGTTPPPATGTTAPAAVALEISSSSPANGAASIALNTAPRVVFNTAVNSSTIVSLTPTAFTLTDVTNGNTVGGFVQLADDGKTATFTPRENLIPNAEYAVTVSTAVISTGGTRLAQNNTWTFTAAPASVESTYPAAAATAVAINSRIAAVFNTAVPPAAVTAASFTLREAAVGGAPVPGTVTYNNDATRTAVFTPTANLQPGTAYTATITTAATGQTTWSFTTGAQLDSDKPTVVFSPANDTEHVSANSAIKLTFSEGIDPSTITGATVFVSDASGVHLSGHLVIDTANRTAMFFPSSAMATSTPYHIIVTSGIKDFAGNAIDTGANLELRSNFKTSAP